MLKLMRKQKFAKKIFYLLAIIIVPSFILWGSATVIRDKQQKGYAGKIFGKKISLSQYLSVLQSWHNQMKIKFGEKARQLEKLFDPNEVVWNKLILLYEARKLKIKVNNQELTNYITSLPFLQKDGIFDPELYKLYLKYSIGASARDFEEEIRQSLKIQKLYNYITEDVVVSEKEAKERYRQEHEQIKVKFIPILFADFMESIELTEQEILNYYNSHKQDFKIPIQINLKYIRIVYPEKENKQQEETEKKIEQIKNILPKTKNLEEIGKMLNLKVKKTGFFSLQDNLADFNLSQEDILNLFNLKENQISDIINTTTAAYVFQLKQKRIDYLPELEKVKEKVKDSLKRERAKALTKEKAETLYKRIQSQKKLSPGIGLDEIAKKLHLSLKETDYFTRNTPVKQADYSVNFNEKAFSLKKGEISKPLELKQGYVIMEVADIKSPDEQEFEKVKRELKQSLLQEKKDETFNKYVAELKKRANLIDYVGAQQNQNSPLNSN